MKRPVGPRCAIFTGAAWLIAAVVAPTIGSAQVPCTTQLARLLPTSPPQSLFGEGACVSGDGATALVGAPAENGGIGAAYVFVRAGDTWTLQQRVTPSGAVGGGLFGAAGAVSLSADGNTAVIGALNENSSMGAAYIFVRTGTAWTQQQRLTPTGAVGVPSFGRSVAISTAGNAALIGARGDNASTGAAYFFVRSGTTWAQQQRLVPTGGVGMGFFGVSVSLSGDDTTALIGASGDDGNHGAAYVFVRPVGGSVWAQQGPKLASIVPSAFGWAVSLSSNGNTALIAAPTDHENVGTAYIFVRSGTTWSMQAKLYGSGDRGRFGNSASLSSDGNTALIGANTENSNVGAAYVFVRSGSAWTQMSPPRLVPTGGIGDGDFGAAASLSGDGSIGIIGARFDNTNLGAAYIFGVNHTFAITQQPVNAVVIAGSDALFTVAAEGDGELTYRWRRGGVFLNDGPTGTGSVVAGANTPTLAISSVAPGDDGAAFTCLVRSACSSSRSDPGTLRVLPRCPADFTQDGTLNSQDFFDFLTAFFAGCP